jgi:uncharacterized membrane protein
MNPPEEYLGHVRAAMRGMEPTVRDDILRELRSHIADATVANGGNVGAALSQLGTPDEIGRRYRGLYGYGRAFRILFVAVAFLLAIPSVPVLSASSEGLFPYLLSLVFLVLVAAWTIWVSVATGSRTGLAAGVAAAASRLLALGVTILAVPSAEVTREGAALFLGTCGMLILLGWLPGTAKKAWSGPRAEL